jgi:hypothetical protein
MKEAINNRGRRTPPFQDVDDYLLDRPVGHPRIRFFFLGGAKNFGLKAAMNKHDNPIMIANGAKTIPPHQFEY